MPLDTSCTIFLDVANAREKEELHELILRDVYERDTPFGLLKLFTKNPIRTKHALFSIVEDVEEDNVVSLPLTSQYSLLQSTDILVSQYGSGAHNTLFLRPGSVLILLLQPGWCDFSWAYANQALLSGVSCVSVYDHLLCVDDLNLGLRGPGGSHVCVAASDFNEFSTLDLHVPPGTEVDLRAWIRRGGSDVGGSDTYRRYKVQGPTEGLMISTVTHGTEGRAEGTFGSPGGGQGGRVKMHDYRIFGGPQNQGPSTLVLPIPQAFRPQAKAENESITHLPSVPRPFVFLHHEKTSGSTLRRHIAAAALSRGLPFYLPCYDGRAEYKEDYRCYSFDLSNATKENGGEREDLKVMGGHFQWGAWGDDAEPDCLVMMRHPVDRAVSLYYERVFSREDELGGRYLNDLTREEWRWILEEWRGSAWEMWRDEGFGDTVCKMLLGESHFRGKKPSEVDWGRVEGMKREAQLRGGLDGKEAVRRMGRCVVGMQGEWEDTKRVIWRWFPWLKSQQFQDDVVRANSGLGSMEGSRVERRKSEGDGGDKGNRKYSVLREDLQEELLKVNRCDMEVWEFSKRRFKEQLDWMDGEGRDYD
ncbi:hypothetical protein TrRE_jg12467 [Triparma retinervis]|uniref:Sulfotransferase domain-containing protein n=1 Tax=Triparma retinervis TaxID=2557542 RepID=A0A9W7KT95_9STRA|nr:hypothetical protein TrRE_jg12467 [Triparma retinervis]